MINEYTKKQQNVTQRSQKFPATNIQQPLSRAVSTSVATPNPASQSPPSSDSPIKQDDQRRVKTSIPTVQKHRGSSAMGASDNKKACEVASTARGDKPAVETAPAVMPIIVTNAGTTLAGRRVSVANVASMLPAVVKREGKWMGGSR